ncbi:MAG: HPF/RaiA family ribosome-associated protein [Gemmatimonadetes bacterium]|nr:HPF/RaiA family ribosome-associated protein [Gemmatimonadota bacterium]
MASGRKAERGGRGLSMGAGAAAVDRAERGRTGATTTPVYFRGAIDADGTLDREFVRARLGDKLGKYARRIDRIDVALGTDRPARGAKASRITIEASVSSGAPVAVTGSGDTARVAFLAAARSAERSVRRWIERKRRTTARARPKRS